MESQNIEFRAVIKFLTKEDASASEIHRRIADVNGDSTPKVFHSGKLVSRILNVGETL